MTTRITKATKNTIPHINFGLSITIRGRKIQLSGISPSPAFRNEFELLKALVAQVNKSLGTKYKIVAG